VYGWRSNIDGGMDAIKNKILYILSLELTSGNAGHALIAAHALQSPLYDPITLTGCGVFFLS